MDFVDIDDILITLLLDAVHDLFDTVLEVTAILCTRQQRADVELVDTTAFQTFWDVALLNHPGQSPDEGRLAHTRLTHMQGVVLVATAEHLDGPLQLLFSAYQRIAVLVEVVHAGDKPSPRSLHLVLARLLFQMVVELVCTDERTHEVTLLVTQCLLQQIAGPRLFQMQDSDYEMRNVKCLRTAVEYLLAGKLYHLSELHGCLRLVVLLLGHFLHPYHLIKQTVNQSIRFIENIKDTNKVLIM